MKTFESGAVCKNGVAKIQVLMPEDMHLTFTEDEGVTARLYSRYLSNVAVTVPSKLGLLSCIRQFVLLTTEGMDTAAEILDAVEESRIDLEKDGYPSEIAAILAAAGSDKDTVKCERIHDSTEKDDEGEYKVRKAKINIAGLLFTASSSYESFEDESYRSILVIHFDGYDNSLEQYKDISGKWEFEYQSAAAVGYTLGIPHVYCGYDCNWSDDEDGVKRFCDDAGLGEEFFNWIMFKD